MVDYKEVLYDLVNSISDQTVYEFTDQDTQEEVEIEGFPKKQKSEYIIDETGVYLKPEYLEYTTVKSIVILHDNIPILSMGLTFDGETSFEETANFEKMSNTFYKDTLEVLIKTGLKEFKSKANK